MTRANFKIITKDGTLNMQCNSSAYPSEMMKPLLTFAISTHSSNMGATNGFYQNVGSNDLATLIDAIGLTIGSVGNASYYYEVDFIKQTVKVWENAMYWVNAPLDWEVRGWNCWKGTNGKYGYSNWRKGKLIYEIGFKSIITVKTTAPSQIICVNSDRLLEAEAV